MTFLETLIPKPTINLWTRPMSHYIISYTYLHPWLLTSWCARIWHATKFTRLLVLDRSTYHRFNPSIHCRAFELKINQIMLWSRLHHERSTGWNVCSFFNQTVHALSNMHSVVSLTLNIPDGWCNRMAAHLLAPEVVLFSNRSNWAQCRLVKKMLKLSFSLLQLWSHFVMFLIITAITFQSPVWYLHHFVRTLNHWKSSIQKVYQLILRCFRLSRHFQVSSCIRTRCQMPAYR